LAGGSVAISSNPMNPTNSINSSNSTNPSNSSNSTNATFQDRALLLLLQLLGMDDMRTWKKALREYMIEKEQID